MIACGAEIVAELAQAAEQYQQTGQATRIFKEFTYQTRESWSQARRVVAQAAGIERESLYRALSVHGNPRLSTLVAGTKDIGLRLLRRSRAIIRGGWRPECIGVPPTN